MNTAKLSQRTSGHIWNGQCVSLLNDNHKRRHQSLCCQLSGELTVSQYSRYPVQSHYMQDHLKPAKLQPEPPQPPHWGVHSTHRRWWYLWLVGAGQYLWWAVILPSVPPVGGQHGGSGAGGQLLLQGEHTSLSVPGEDAPLPLPPPQQHITSTTAGRLVYSQRPGVLCTLYCVLCTVYSVMYTVSLSTVLFVLVSRHRNSISVIPWWWYDIWVEKEKAWAYTFIDSRDL